MKTTKAFVAICMMALFAACSSESTGPEPNILGNNQIQFATTTSPSIESRAINGTASLQDQKFVVGNPINVYLTEAATGSSIAPHVIGSQAIAASEYYKFTADVDYTGDQHTEYSQVLKAPNNYIFQYPGTDKVNVYALLPAFDDKEVLKTTETFSVEKDQTSDDAYQKSDLISAVATNKTKQDGTIFLDFCHKLSKVVVKLQAAANESMGLVLDGATVTMNAKTTIGLDHSDITAANAEGLKLKDNSAADDETITLGTYNADGIAGIIVPQTVEKDQPLLKVKLASNGATFSYTPGLDPTVTDEDLKFESGKVYIYTLTLKADLLTLVSIQIKDWDKVDRTGDAILE